MRKRQPLDYGEGLMVERVEGNGQCDVCDGIFPREYLNGCHARGTLNGTPWVCYPCHRGCFCRPVRPGWAYVGLPPGREELRQLRLERENA